MSVCCRAVYMVLQVVLVRLHGGSLHPHQPLRQTDEEWSVPGNAQHTQPGERCAAYSSGKSGVLGLSHCRVHEPVPSLQCDWCTGSQWSLHGSALMATQRCHAHKSSAL